MPIAFKCPHCQNPVNVPDGTEGRRGTCAKCGKTIMVPVDDKPLRLGITVDPDDLLDGLPEPVPHPAVASPAARPASTTPAAPLFPDDEEKLWEYKVMTQKDKWFSGKFDPEKIEGALNAYAKQGWRMKAVATASVPGFGGNRDEVIVFFERSR